MTDGEHQQPHGAAAHHLRRMTGRDPHERGRVATPLELLFDLTFVVAFGVSASQFAHALAADHLAAGLTGFMFTVFAVCWAWVNFSWFSSAFDTDDWVYRLTTMLQMVGVVILTLGIAPVYASIEKGHHVDNGVLVAGYVVMRTAMVCQWLRAARQDPQRRAACLTYVTSIVVAQVGWIAAIFMSTSVPTTIGIYAVLIFIELLGPWLAEHRTSGTPWHAHHIAERYGLLTIITLGEGVIGTVATLSAVVQAQGWTVDAVLVGAAGIGLTFGMWWMYYVVPAAPILHARRDRSFGFGYGHIVIVGTIVATGAGLHAAAYYLEHHSKLGSTHTVLAVAVPVAVYILSLFGLYRYLVRSLGTVHVVAVTIALGVLTVAVVLAAQHVSMAICLVVVTLAPIAVVVGHEVSGHRHVARATARVLAADAPSDPA